MKITDFMATIMPSFSREHVEDEVESLKQEVNDINIPIFEGGFKLLGKDKMTSDVANDMGETLYKGIGLKNYPNFIGGFLEINKKIRDQLPVVERWVRDKFGEDISKHAMDPLKYNVLQLIPVMGFVARYCRMFYNVAISIECNIKSDSPEPVFDIIPYQRDWLAKHLTSFIDSVRLIMKRAGDLDKIFENLPDIVIDPRNAGVVQQTQGNLTDPLNFGIIPLSINPIFLIRKIHMNYQADRYHLAKEELRMLERKVYNLKQMNEGRNDAKLQREIRYTEEKRIIPLAKKIADWEEEYGAR